jgi:ribosome-binding protein aMBF1 (putative translation factor)
MNSHYDNRDMVIGNKSIVQRTQQKHVNNLPGTKELRQLEEDDQAGGKKITLDKSKEIQRLRALTGLSQKELNQKLCYPVNTITDYESGKCAFKEHIYKKIINYLENYIKSKSDNKI